MNGYKTVNKICKRNIVSKTNDILSFDVVIAGGGSIGSSILYHLRERGINAILLERHSLTSGTTWHSAGMLWRLRPSDIDIELHAHTRRMCKDLEAETGIQSWYENGGLFVANNKERMSEYERLSETGKYFGIESRTLSPSEIQEVHPLIQVDDVFGGIYSPGDGTIDPTGIVNAYAKAAKTRGGIIKENTGVIGVDLESKGNVKQVVGVHTSTGEYIKTKWLVNACGAWSNEIANLAGVNIPLLAMKHAFVVTETIPGMHKDLPNVRDHDLSIYLKTQGDAMALGGYEQNPEFWRHADPSFSFGLFDLDWDTFGQNLNGQIQRCPAIASVGIKSTVCGPESFTPDHKPLVGPQPGVRGLFHACGFNSMGMMLGGGMGREVATWIDEGSPSVDMFAYDCARYHHDSIQDKKWVKDRTHESYAKTYSIVFPHDESLAGRGSRKSALHDILAKRGCIYQARHGYERPGWYVRDGQNREPPSYDYYGAYDEGGWRLCEDGIDSVKKNTRNLYLDSLEKELTFDWPGSMSEVAQECYAARNGAVIFDQSYFGKFLLSGEDADSAIQYICGADMEMKGLGSVTYTPLCNDRGGVEADLTVTKLPDGSGYYFAAGGNTMSKDYEWISTVIEEKQFRVELQDLSDRLSMISVQGPHSRNILKSLVSDTTCLDNESLPFSTCQSIILAGVKLWCLRLTFVGELGFELHVPYDDAPKVYTSLRQAADEYEKHHGVPVLDAGYRAIDSLSAEKNYRHWHADISNKDTPMEAGIGFTVLSKLKRDGVDFKGRRALERQRASGLKRKLVCFLLDEKVPLNGLETIWRDSECIGLVRSTAFGFSIDKTICYGYIDAPNDTTISKKWLDQGTWSIGDRGKMYTCSVCHGAPFDPKNERIKL